MVLCFREHFECSLERQGSSGFCWRISLQHHPRAWVLLLCISFEDDLGITVCWPRETSGEKRAPGLMAHGKMDRSKQKRESWDVTYGPHTLSIRQGPKQCLCQGNACMLSPASCPWERVRCLISPSAIRARCSSTAATKTIQSSQLLPVGGAIFYPEAGFTCPPTPALASESCEEPPWLQTRLQDAASPLEWAPGPLLAALPDRAPGLGSAPTRSDSHCARDNTGHFKLCPAARAGWHCSRCCGVGRKGHHNTLLQNILLSRSQSQHQCP